ncbi:MAG: DUF998 domain-containing protein [Halopenitus sp.]
MDRRGYRTIAGGAFLAVATLLLLGFVTAAAQYPGYSATTQTISALGAAEATGRSRAIFNGTMILAGLGTLVATYGLHQRFRNRGFTVALAATGIGNAGVGVFPAETGVPHVLAAMLAFGGIGCTALLVAREVGGPFGALSASVGVLELVVLVLFITVGGSTPLGLGGLERWVAYLGILWAAAFGGYLLPGSEPAEPGDGL